MEDLSWNEFKKYVEKFLIEKEISFDTKIWYIDMSFPTTDDVIKETLIVGKEDRLGLFISN